MMRRALIATLTTLLFSVLPAVAQAAADPPQMPKYTIAVGNLENAAATELPDAEAFSKQWHAELMDQLVATGRFNVAERFTLDAVLVERSLNSTTMEAFLRDPRAPRLVLLATITDFQTKKGKGLVYLLGRKEQTEIRADFKVVDLVDGTVVAAKSVVGVSTGNKSTFNRTSGFKDPTRAGDSVQSAMTNAITEGVAWIAENLAGISWSGSVVLVEGDLVYIDLGAVDGVSEGLTLAVTDAEATTRDPETGEMLSSAAVERARIEIVKVGSKISTGKVVQGDASTLSQGMRVTSIPRQ